MSISDWSSALGYFPLSCKFNKIITVGYLGFLESIQLLCQSHSKSRYFCSELWTICEIYYFCKLPKLHLRFDELKQEQRSLAISILFTKPNILPRKFTFSSFCIISIPLTNSFTGSTLMLQKLL